jgi:polyribonucleotide nucleotidyltransferase
MFPKYWRYETQVLATVFSAEPDVDPDTLGAVGASAALMISDIPFHGPISEVRVGRLEGEFVINPPQNQLKFSDVDITVAGTDSSIVMVEGGCKEISEEDFLKALEFAHSKIIELNALQMELVKVAHKDKREFEEDKAPEEIEKVIREIGESGIDSLIQSNTKKAERTEIRKNLKTTVLDKITELFGDKEEYSNKPFDKYVEDVLSDIEKIKMRKMILDEGKRLDGRKLNEIRDITCEIGLLPRCHGSALFTRGETQSLTSVTLGTKRDEQIIDGLLPVYTSTFILHYNFPPFSTGEVKRLGVGRREIGHGNLAERALKNLLPKYEDFPYTIRVVSDILESNGSSSMATVCAGSLALFDAGVPLMKAVAGVAMGLIKENEKVAILSDILGDEDHLGDMDFKVTGTIDGITACQMDIKIEGISLDIMREALEQARQGRLYILDIMNNTISEPRQDISIYAPRFTSMTIPTDMIGAVIGSGGETIRSISRETETEINIEDDGTILIAATSTEAAEKARRMIEQVIQKPEEGEIYTGKVKEVRDGLGAIVEFLPGKKGLVHISQIAHEKFANVSDIIKEGDSIEVKLIEVTRDGKYRLSRKVLLPRIEGDDEILDDPSDYKRSSYSSRKPISNVSREMYSEKDRRGFRDKSKGRDKDGDKTKDNRHRRRY